MVTATCLFQACDDDGRFDVYDRLDWVTNRAFVETGVLIFWGAR
jgi:hypothetical protein